MREAVDRFADGDDGPCRFVAEHQRRLDDEAANPAMPVIVRVRPADTHRRHPDQHVTGAGLGTGRCVHFDSARLDEYGSPHLGIRGSVVCVTFAMLA